MRKYGAPCTLTCEKMHAKATIREGVLIVLQSLIGMHFMPILVAPILHPDSVSSMTVIELLLMIAGPCFTRWGDQVQGSHRCANRNAVQHCTSSTKAISTAASICKGGSGKTSVWLFTTISAASSEFLRLPKLCSCSSLRTALSTQPLVSSSQTAFELAATRLGL